MPAPIRARPSQDSTHVLDGRDDLGSRLEGLLPFLTQYRYIMPGSSQFIAHVYSRLCLAPGGFCVACLHSDPRRPC